MYFSSRSLNRKGVQPPRHLQPTIPISRSRVFVKNFPFNFFESFFGMFYAALIFPLNLAPEMFSISMHVLCISTSFECCAHTKAGRNLMIPVNVLIWSVNMVNNKKRKKVEISWKKCFGQLSVCAAPKSWSKYTTCMYRSGPSACFFQIWQKGFRLQRHCRPFQALPDAKGTLWRRKKINKILSHW